MSSGLLGSLTLIYAAITVLMLVGTVSIVRKAGYSGWWVLSCLVPMLNIVMFLVFAFSDWPALSNARYAQQAQAAQAGPDPRFTYPTG